jgi:hypothetical protein
MRRPMSRDGGGLHAASLCLRSALPATLCFIHFRRSWQRELETKKFLRLSRQDYGLFAAKICFKPQLLLLSLLVAAAVIPDRGA